MSNYCKECGKELPQNSKTNSCEFHQNKKNGKTRRILEGVLGVAGAIFSIGLLVITKGKFGNPKS